MVNVFRNILRFVVLASILWIVFYLVDRSLPGIRSGSDQVYHVKLRYIAHNDLFRKDAKYRVVIFGNSKVLSGFIPSTFDRLSDNHVSSFNMGLPNAVHFINELSQIVERGNHPTHVLLTIPWDAGPLPSYYDQLRDDDSLMQHLFPFRRFPRDLALFLIRSLSHGGVATYYREVLQLLDRMIADRGYHFIESQSHYPNHRLPEDFRLESDDPTRIESRDRDIMLAGPLFAKLKELQQRAGFHVLFVPIYLREGERAPVVPNEDSIRFFRTRRIDIVGPDYWLFPSSYFSDPGHLNPEGAALYTTRLWELLRGWFDEKANGFMASVE